jgi:Alpha/beta hydrolase family
MKLQRINAAHTNLSERTQPAMKRPFRIIVTGLLVAAVAVMAMTVYSLIAVRGTFDPQLPVSEAPTAGEMYWGKPGHRIASRVFGDNDHVVRSPLVVVLHGDAPFHNPGYHFVFASRLAKALPGTIVVAMLRPGYSDPYGMKSDGSRGFAIAQDYTPGVVADIAYAIHQIKTDLNISSVSLVGHSGGAAIAADVAALNPELVSHVYLVSCPCDLPAFRKHMASAQHDPMWLLPSYSLSPVDTLDEMGPRMEITAISGSADGVTLPQYARAYVAKADARGLNASMIVLPGEAHDILLDPRVINAIATGVRADNPKPLSLPTASVQ